MQENDRDKIIDELAGRIKVVPEPTLEEILGFESPTRSWKELKPFEKVVLDNKGKHDIRVAWRKHVRSLSLNHWRPSMLGRVWTWYWMKHDYPRMDDDWINFLLPAVILSHGKQAPSDRPLYGETPGPENVNPNLGM